MKFLFEIICNLFSGTAFLVVFGLIVSVPLIIYMYRWEDYLETMDDGLSTAEIFHKAGEGKW